MPFEPTPPEQMKPDGGRRKPQPKMHGQDPGRVAIQLREEVAAVQVFRRVHSGIIKQSRTKHKTHFVLF